MAAFVPPVPPGWPAEVPPPGSDDFTARAVDLVARALFDAS